MPSAFPSEFPSLARALAGQFAVERELGRGGMGVVLLARDLMLDRLVAIKVLPPTLARDPAVRERFLREARTAARLSHPNVVPVHRADEIDGAAFFVMAYVEGESLADRVRDRGPLPPAEAVRILREVAWALAYAHARGVVHRDVKPENILLERHTGRALVGDFGIARQTEAPRLTQDGHVLGTVYYMSPEQVNGEEVDGRSDLYSLGVVAYYVLSGRLPFEGMHASAILVSHATREPPPLSSVAPHLPQALAAVVDRCLRKSPDDRYPTGEALADALGAAIAATPAAALPDDGLPDVVNAEQAAAIWRRAAQLQADAAHRLEARRDLLATVAGGAANGGANGDANDGTSAASLTSGYRLQDVAAAAEEAGISRQYVVMALAELPKGTLPSTASHVMGVSEREAELFLGTEERSLGVSHVVRATPARTLRALGVVLQQSPYELRLRETVGAHPLDGGVIVFDLTGEIVGMANASASELNFYWMGTHQQLEARQLQVTLRALPGEPARTEVTMTCDLRPGVRRNVRTSQWIAGGVGAGSGFFTGAILAKGAAVAASATVLGPAILVGGAVAGVSLAWYRWLYPSVLKKSRREMLGALEAVAAAVQSEEVFGTLPGPGRPRGGAPTGWSGDGGAGAAVNLG